MTGDKIEFKQLRPGSQDYQQTLALREQVLRRPLGLRLSAADVADDRGDRHFALLDGSRVVACVAARGLEADVWKLRQMAVAADRQRQGLGARLMRGALAVLRAPRPGRVVLNARREAIGFYERLGFVCVGPPLLEIGIPHHAMAIQWPAGRGE